MKLNLYSATHGAYLSVRNLPVKIREQILKHLTAKNPNYEQAKAFSTHRFVSPDIPEFLYYGWFFDDELTMLRGCIDMLPRKLQKILLSYTRWKDIRIFRPVKFPEMHLELHAEQQQVMNAVEVALQTGKRRFGNLLILASTALGKTLLSAAIAERLGQKTLVLFPTELIRRAWEADLKKAYKFKTNEIGLIQRNKWKDDAIFTLASIQTIGRRRHLWEEMNQEFGTIIVDEVQGVSARSYYDFLQQSPAAYLIGATATQETRSGEQNTPLIALFGKPVIEVNTYHRETSTSLRITEAKLITTNFNFEHQVDNMDWNELAVEMTCDEDRNNLILTNVKKEWLDKRVVLIVTKRVEHVRVLFDMATEAGINNVNILTGETNTDKFYTSKLLAMVKSRQVTCIIATMQAIKVGANLPTLDSLHIAMPPANMRDLEQLIGRIRRKTTGKNEATVTYYYDNKMPYLMRLFRKIVIPTFRKLKIAGYENMYAG